MPVRTAPPATSSMLTRHPHRPQVAAELAALEEVVADQEKLEMPAVPATKVRHGVLCLHVCGFGAKGRLGGGYQGPSPRDRTGRLEMACGLGCAG